MTETEYLRGYRDALAESLARIKADPYLRPEPPARIPEPGLWGVVTAIKRNTRTPRLTFVNVNNDRSSNWIDVEDSDGGYDWADLIDPVLIRDGVTP
jgi:hypothetical protein